MEGEAGRTACPTISKLIYESTEKNPPLKKGVAAKQTGDLYCPIKNYNNAYLCN